MAISVTIVLLGGCDSAATRPSPAKATLTPDRALSDAELQQSAAIVRHRLALLHVSPATVAIEVGALRITVPSAAAGRIAEVGNRDLVSLRPVLSEQVATGSACAPGSANQDPIYRPAEPTVACSADGTLSYRLGPVIVDSNGIASARAVRDEISGTTKIYLTCTPDAARALAAQTAALQGDQLAIDVDQTVLGTPVVAGPITDGVAEITGGYQTAEAEELATLFASRVLPTAFALTWPSAGRSDAATAR